MIRISQAEEKRSHFAASSVVDEQERANSGESSSTRGRFEEDLSDQNVPTHQFPSTDHQSAAPFDQHDLLNDDSGHSTDDNGGESGVTGLVRQRAFVQSSQEWFQPRALLDSVVVKAGSGQSGANGGAIKRACDDADVETDDDLVALTSSSLNYERRSPAKKPKFVVTYREMREFFALLNEETIQQFLKRDSCCLISDKYALAMVFTYFKRAKFYLNEYTRTNFYLALYLASDIEEDVDDYKYEIFPWALGRRWRSKFTGFLRKRDALLRRIGYRAIVSRKCCEEVMSLVPDHSAWKRERSEDHGGATRAYLINRGKRYLSIKANMGYEELNFPRGPTEKPRPCLLCMLNRGSNSIATFVPTLSSGIIDNDECEPSNAGFSCPLSVSSLDDGTTSSGIDLTSVTSDQSDDSSRNYAKLTTEDESQDEGIQSSESENKSADSGSAAEAALQDPNDKYVNYLSSNAHDLAKTVSTRKPKPIVKVSSHQDCAIASIVSCAKSASANHLQAPNESRMPKISNHSLNRIRMDEANNNCSKFPSSNKFCDRKQSASDLENTSFGAVSVYDSFFDESCYYEAKAYEHSNNASDYVPALPPVAQRPPGGAVVHKVTAAATTTTTVLGTKPLAASKTAHAPLTGYKFPSATSMGHLLVQDIMTSDEDIIDDDDYYHGEHLGEGAFANADGDYENDDVFASSDVNATITKQNVSLSDYRRNEPKLKALEPTGSKKETVHRRRLNYSLSTNSAVSVEGKHHHHALSLTKAISSVETKTNPMSRHQLTHDQQVPVPATSKC